MTDEEHQGGFTQCDMQEAYDRGVQQAAEDAQQSHRAGWRAGLLAGFALGLACMMLVEILR